MKTIEALLDEAKEKSDLPSDYALAKEMGVKKQTVSRYRLGQSTPDIYAMSRLAEITGRPLNQVIAMIEVETETDETKRNYWRNFYERLGGLAASIAFVTFIVSPHPTEAAETQAKSLNNNVYYVKSHG